MIKRFHRFTYCFILGLLIIAGCNTTNKKSVKVDHKPTMLNSEKENVKLNTLEDSLEIFTITKASRIDYINAKKIYSDKLVEDTLNIRKKNGSIELPLFRPNHPNSVFFTDTLVANSEEDYREYHYLGQYPNLNVYLVSGSFWEHYECYLVNKKTGESTVIWNDPKISPSSEYLANLSIGFGLEGYPTGMQIWKKDKKEKELMKLVEIDQKIWAPEDFVWESENTILLKVFSEDQFWKSNGELKNNDYYYLRLTLN